MALGEYENRVWEAQIAGLEDLDADFVPISLKVQYILESPGDFYSAIEENMAKGLLDDEAKKSVAWFFGHVLYSVNPEAVIAELPYVETDEGLEVQLVFPVHKELRE